MRRWGQGNARRLPRSTRDCHPRRTECRRHCRERWCRYSPVRDPPVISHIEYTDVLKRLGLRTGSLDDVEAAFVRGEAQAVRPLKIVGDDSQRVVARIEAVDVGGQFRLLLAALVIGLDP